MWPFKGEDPDLKYYAYHQEPKTISDRFAAFAALFILVSIPLTVFLVSQARDPSSRAAREPQKAIGPNVTIDSDGDGFSDSVEKYLGTYPDAGCDIDLVDGPSPAWPADLETASASAGRVDLHDVGSFVSPVRRLGTSPGDPGYDRRWDLSPGKGEGEKQINEEDVQVLYNLEPKMFAGKKAYLEAACP